MGRAYTHADSGRPPRAAAVQPFAGSAVRGGDVANSPTGTRDNEAEDTYGSEQFESTGMTGSLRRSGVGRLSGQSPASGQARPSQHSRVAWSRDLESGGRPAAAQGRSVGI